MDQKNTIVKCAKHKCLFNNCGTCDQYVITIGIDNTCQAYTETKSFTFKEQKVCHPDCIHFDDSDIMVGPICLFKHPEPLKEFYEGMPCDYYHSTNYTRGQRAKCNFYEDTTFDLCSAACHNYDFKGASLYCQLRQEYLGPERLMKPCDLFVKAENDKFTVKMKLIQLDEINKNQSVISDWAYAATPDICKTCKKVVYGQPCKYKNVTNGVWACYEIDETIKKAGTLNECWWCDFFNSEKRKCKHKDPDIDKLGCHSSQSTGGNR